LADKQENEREGVKMVEEIEIAMIDPLIMMGVISNPALKPIANEARERLERVAKALEK
jgi:hypothetical protein